MLLFLGIIEFGIAVFTYDNVASAAREGARYGIIHPDDTAGIIAAVERAAAGLDLSALTIDPTRTADTVQVEVTYIHGLLTGPMIQVTGGSPTWTFYTLATMQIER
jgi:Flp pilus assembly protein TadG